MSVLSYNQILELFQQIANSHYQIQRFGSGELSEADLNKFISLNPNYPVFWATPIDVTSEPNTILYRFNLLFFDIVNKDKNNEQEVLSDTLQIALDVFRILKLEDNEFGVVGEPTINPFSGRYSEWVTGWSMEISIQVNFQENLCDIPYKGLNLTQILKNLTGDGIGGFGCDDLGTCIDIININTNIANLDANQITGGTYFSGTSTITLTNKTGGTIDITGITTSNQFNCDDLLNCTVVANSISGGTYQDGCLTLFNNSGGTTQICGFISADTYTTGGTYTSGQIVFTRNDGQTYVVTGIPIGGGGGQIYYLNENNPQSPYREFSPDQTNNPTAVRCSTINQNSTVTFREFQTPLNDPNTNFIPPGVWSFYLHGCRVSVNSAFDIWVEVYKRSSGGTETLLFQTTPVINPFSICPSVNMIITDAVFSGSVINNSDRIVAKLIVRNTTNQPHQFCFYTEGSQYYSFAITTFTNNGKLTCDNLSGCSIIQQIQTDISNKYDKSGGTINGNVFINGGLTANTISATTYQNLPTDIRVTGATYNNANQFTFTNNTGGTFDVSFNTVTGLTATTISATTYINTVNNAGIVFGDGFDGDIVLDGINTYSAFTTFTSSTYTLTRNIYPNNLTINSGITLNTNGYIITCKNIMSVSGTCGSVGNNGTNGNTPPVNCSGAAATANGAASLKPNNTINDQVLNPPNQAGGNGTGGSAWGSAGGSISVTYNYHGGIGGAGGRGVTQGTNVLGAQATVSLGTGGKFQPYFNSLIPQHIIGNGALPFCGTPGAGGGLGSNHGGSWGGGGGAGGSPAFGVRIVSKELIISLSGIIRSNGGNGGNGAGGTQCSAGTGWSGGGGGGGAGGGIVHIVTNKLTYTPNNQIQAKGGIGGTNGGRNNVLNTLPTDGSNGSDGFVHIYDTSTGSATFYVGQY